MIVVSVFLSHFLLVRVMMSWVTPCTLLSHITSISFHVVWNLKSHVHVVVFGVCDCILCVCVCTLFPSFVNLMTH